MKKKIAYLILIMAILLSACSPKKTSQMAATDANSNVQQNSSETGTSSDISANNNSSSKKDIGNALNLVMGSSEGEPSVFDSYHIELLMDTPQPNEDYTAVINETTSISADVQGKNIHIFQLDPGATEPKEGYIIGDNDTEYKLVDGTWQQSLGFIAMAWAMWPLQVVVPYSYAASLYANEIGSEEIDGRTAFVYELDSTKGDPVAQEGMKEFSMDMVSKGKVWIDKETGGMLKLQLDYTSDLTSLDGSKSIGSGTGHIDLEITRVNKVTVTSPV